MVQTNSSGANSRERKGGTYMIRDVGLVLDDRFGPLVNSNARLEKLYEGCRWAEGPAYFPAGRYLIWSDIPNDRMMRYDETTGAVGVFRQPAGYSNGNTVDRQGRLVTCEHGNRRVTRPAGLFERQHGRPTGTPRHLRARQPARHADKGCRVGKGDREPFRRQA